MSAPQTTLTFSGAKSQLPSGSAAIGPVTILNLNSGGAVTEVVLDAGDNTVSVPSAPAGVGYVGALIVPSASNTGVLTLKGAGGDSGVIIHPINPMYLGLGAGQTGFVLNLSAGTCGVEINWI